MADAQSVYVAPDAAIVLDGYPHQRRRAKDLLILDSPASEADGLVQQALEKMESLFGGDAKIQATREKLNALGASGDVANATQRLESGGLDRMERLLLSVPGVYATIMGDALELSAKGHLKLDDTIALVNFVKRALNDGGNGDDKHAPRARFAAFLVDGVVAAGSLHVAPSLRAATIERVRYEQVPLKGDRAAAAISVVIDGLRSNGPLLSAVEKYAPHSGIDITRLTDPVKRAMVDGLKSMGLDPLKESAKTVFPDYFAIAYSQAIARSNGASNDPIDAVRRPGAISDWDFTIDQFEGVEEQGVIVDNILAAGALDYIYNLGERLGIYQLADAIVLKWGTGAIDLEPGETPAKLYRYWKLRAERTTPEERAMLYKRVLNKGDGAMLDGMVSNDIFPELWGGLMSSVADYITKLEDKSTTAETGISRQRVYQSTKQLQYNLTEFMTGMALMQVNEMYHHLMEARAILEDPQIVDYFGAGRRKTIWTVIERASKEWFNVSHNIAAIRTVAVDGNKIFRWIAEFDGGTTTDADFENLRNSAEAWILAQASDGSVPAAPASEADTSAPGDSDAAADDFNSDWDK